MNSNKNFSRVAKLWFETGQYEVAALNYGKALKRD
jgi:hypothetical protein